MTGERMAQNASLNVFHISAGVDAFPFLYTRFLRYKITDDHQGNSIIIPGRKPAVNKSVMEVPDDPINYERD